MSTTIDNKVVQMEFDNSRFEKNVSQSMTTLDKLKSSLEFKDASLGLDKLNDKIGKISFSGLSNGIDAVKVQLSTMQIIGVTAISTITKAAISAGAKIYKALVGPITEGGKNRALNIAAAKFQFEGLGMDVEKAMESANYAVEGTAYGLDAAAKVASQLGASGMKAGADMSKALRSISGVAAMTGSSYEEIGQIFTTISGNGRLMSEQLNQFSTRGINAAATLAKQLNKTEAEIREMVHKGQISFKMFYEAMDDAFGEHAKDANKTFTGAMSNIKSALSRIGADIATPLMDSLINPFNEIRLVINKVRKTLSPFSAELGVQFKKMADIFVDMMKIVNGDNYKFSGLESLINNLIYFMRMDGLINIINGIRSAFSNLGKITDTIKEAFRDIFPPANIKTITDATRAFKDMMSTLKPSEEVLSRIKLVFESIFFTISILASSIKNFVLPFVKFEEISNMLSGLFAIFDIGRQAVLALLMPITSLLKIFGRLLGVVLSSGSSLGLWLVNLDESIQKSGIFLKIGKGLADIIDAFGTSLSFGLTKLKDFIALIGSKISFPGFEAFGKFIDSLFEKVGGVTGIFSKIFTFIASVIGGIANAIGNLSLTDKIASFGKTFIQWFGRIAEMLATMEILSLARRLVFAIRSVVDSLTLGLGNLGGTIKGFAKSLSTFLDNSALVVKAKALREFAISIAILAGSMALLSLIDTDKAATAFGSITGLVIELMMIMKTMTKLKNIPFLINLVGGAMIQMSIAVLILAAAMKSLSSLSLEEIGRGLTAVGGLLAGITAVAYALSKLKVSSFMKGATGLIAMAFAVKILGSAMTTLGSMDPSELQQGLFTVIGLMAAMAAFATATDGTKKMLSIGLGMIGVATAVKILGSAMKTIGSLDGNQLETALVGIAGGLTLLAIALNFMKGTFGASASLLIASIALAALGGAMLIIANLDWDKLAISLTGIGIVLLELAVGLNAMNDAIVGAAALLVAAGAIVILAPALLLLQAVNIETIAKNLGVLLLALLGISAISTLIMPAIAVIGLLAASFMFAGIGALTFGAGIALLGAGLATFAGLTTTALSAAVFGIQTVISGLLTMMPKIATSVAYALIAFLKTLADLSPALIEAISGLIDVMLYAVKDAVPKIIDVLLTIVEEVLKAFDSYSSMVIDTVINVITNLLTKIRDTLPQFINAGVEIIKAYAEGIGRAVPMVVDAGFKMVIDFINGIAKAINDNMPVLVAAVKNLVDAILRAFVTFITGGHSEIYDVGKNVLEGFLQGMTSIVGAVIDKVKNIFTSVLNAAKSVLGIHSPSTEFAYIAEMCGTGFTNEMENQTVNVSAASTNFGNAIYSNAKVAADQGGEETFGIVKNWNKKIANEMANAPELTADQKAVAWYNERKKRTKEARENTAKWIAEEHDAMENLKEVTEEVESIPDPLSTKGSGGKAKKEKEKYHAEIITDETGFWTQLLEVKKKGLEGEKYYNMELQDFGESLVKDAKELTTNYLNEWDKLRDKNIGGLFDEATTIKEVGKDELQKRLDERLKQMTEFRNVLSSLNKKITDEKVKAAIDEMSISSLGELRAINSMTEEELKHLVDTNEKLFTVSTQASAEQMTSNRAKTEEEIAKLIGVSEVNLSEFITTFDGTFASLGNYMSQFQTVGYNMTAGVSQGMIGEAAMTNIGTAAMEVVDEVTNELKNYAEIHSPSQLLEREVGEYLTAGVAEGMKNSTAKGYVVSAAQMAVNAAIARFRQCRLQFFLAGQYVMDGFIEGMKSKENDITRAAEELAWEAYEAACAALGINSPSRKFMEVGKYSALGMAVGIKDYSKEVVSASKEVADVALAAMSDAITRAGKTIQNGVDASPVIRPVLDLSNIEAGSKTLDSLVSRNKAYGISASMTAHAEEAVKLRSSSGNADISNGNTTFIQNNYSPRALSRTEIYRQTKNQLALARG